MQTNKKKLWDGGHINCPPIRCCLRKDARMRQLNEHTRHGCNPIMLWHMYCKFTYLFDFVTSFNPIVTGIKLDNLTRHRMIPSSPWPRCRVWVLIQNTRTSESTLNLKRHLETSQTMMVKAFHFGHPIMFSLVPAAQGAREMPKDDSIRKLRLFCKTLTTSVESNKEKYCETNALSVFEFLLVRSS